MATVVARAGSTALMGKGKGNFGVVVWFVVWFCVDSTTYFSIYFSHERPVYSFYLAPLFYLNESQFFD